MTDQEILENEAEEAGKKIENSQIFLSLLTENYKKGAMTALQLGIAIMLDKPICLVVLKGVAIPEHLRKIAFSIQYFEDSEGGVSLKQAVEASLEASKRFP